ncbi:MAG: hypothetical protein EBY28_04370 [Betaproteobacteria bacterium]|nr:hypothetical protein [Betaproteobacteria bacterium]
MARHHLRVVEEVYAVFGAGLHQQLVAIAGQRVPRSACQQPRVVHLHLNALAVDAQGARIAAVGVAPCQHLAIAVES